MAEEKQNIGNVVRTFQPDYITKISALSVKISNADKPTSSEVAEFRKELIDAREDLLLVTKFLNQDITTLTGLNIAAKKREAFEQSAISIFEFVGTPEDKKLKELESKEEGK